MAAPPASSLPLNSSLAIDVDHLSKSYREGLIFPRIHAALKEVSLQVTRGEVFGLLGPNGAGKTTLIKVLLGILHPNKGSAQVLKLPAGSKAARRRIGYLPENLVFPRHHTARSALYFYGRLSEMSNSQIAARENELFELVSLKGRENEAVRRYSKGMRQRLGLSQAMLHDPDLLILDEPTDGLDPMGRSQIREVLEKMKNRGKTVFLNSHILQEVELICDRVAIMALGKLRGIGTIDGLIRNHTQENAAALVLEVIALPSSIEQLHILPENASVEPIVFESLVEQSSAATELTSTAAQHLSRISIPSIDQAGADRLVDALRANNISILRIERARPSLEQVFMNIVGAAK